MAKQHCGVEQQHREQEEAMGAGVGQVVEQGTDGPVGCYEQ